MGDDCPEVKVGELNGFSESRDAGLHGTGNWRLYKGVSDDRPGVRQLGDHDPQKMTSHSKSLGNGILEPSTSTLEGVLGSF